MRPSISPKVLGQLDAVEDDLPDTLRLVPALDARETIPCPRFAQKLAAASVVCEEGEDLVALMWTTDDPPFSL
jgi:hypothetical protein